MDDQLDNLLREIIGVRDELQRHHDNNYLQDFHQLKRREADLIALLYKALVREGLHDSI